MKKLILVASLALFLSLLGINLAHAQGTGTIPQLQQFVATTSPVAAITQAVFGKAFRLSGQSDGCAQFSNSGVLSSTGSACGSGGGGSFTYDWLQSNNTFGANSLTPTTTIPVNIKATATSTFAGGLEAWRQISAPYFQATSSTIFSQFLNASTTNSRINFLTLPNVPTTRVLFTTTGGLVTNSSGLTFSSGTLSTGVLNASSNIITPEWRNPGLTQAIDLDGTDLVLYPGVSSGGHILKIANGLGLNASLDISGISGSHVYSFPDIDGTFAVGTGVFGNCAEWDGTNTIKDSGAPCGGSGSPGGSDTQIQFNDTGSFAGDSDFTWDKLNDVFTISKSNRSGTLLTQYVDGTDAVVSSDGRLLMVGDVNANQAALSLKHDAIDLGYINNTQSGENGSPININASPASDGDTNAGNINILGNSGSGSGRGSDINIAAGGLLAGVPGSVRLLDSTGQNGFFVDDPDTFGNYGPAVKSSTHGVVLNTSNLSSDNTIAYFPDIGGTGDVFCFQTLANCSSGGSSFGYPFALTGNATSTLTQFNGGLTAYASTTIGNGTVTGGLTVSGNSTTTGGALFTGSSITFENQSTSIGQGTTLRDAGASTNLFTSVINPAGTSNANLPTTPLAATFQTGAGTTGGLIFVSKAANSPVIFAAGGSTFASERMRIAGNGNVGVASTTPGTLFSIGADAVGINFTLATSSFATTGGLNLKGGCYAINGVCIGTGAGSVTGVTATYPILSTGGTAPVISTAFGTTTNIGIGNDLVLYTSHAGVPIGVATSTLTPSSPLTGSLTQIGSSGTLGIQAANTSQSGYLTSTDWNTFNNKLSTSLTKGNFHVGDDSGIVQATSTIFITSTGNIGIGTSLPTAVNANARLTVAGVSSQDIIASTTDNTTLSDAILQAYAPGSRIFMGAHGTNQVTSRYGITLGGWGEIGAFNSSFGTTNGLVIGTNPAVPIVFGTNNLERARIDSAGSVGIGTTTPGSLLSLGNTGANTINISATATSTFGSGLNIRTGCFSINGVCIGTGSFTNTIASGGTGSTAFSPNSIVTSNAAGTALIATGTQLTVGNLVATTTANSTFVGSVGIGTTSPVGKLEVVNASANYLRYETAGQLTLRTDGSTRPRINLRDELGNGEGYLDFYTYGPVIGQPVQTVPTARWAAIDTGSWTGSQVFYTATGGSPNQPLLERLRITGAGNIGISTSTPGTLLSLGDTGANTVNISATATSTFGSGINLRTGCFAINSICLSGGGATLSGTLGQTAYFSGANTAVGTSTLFVHTNSFVGVGTTTPQYPLSIISALGPQLSLGEGAGKSQITMRNEGGIFDLSSTTVAGTATSTLLTLNGLLGVSPGLTIASQTATSTLGGFAVFNVIRQNGDVNPLMAIASSSATGSASPVFELDRFGHILTSGPKPTLSSCGTSPSVVGNDQAGTITVGSVAATGCTLTFANAYPTAPSCTITNYNMSVVNALSVAVSASAITLTQTGLTSAVVAYACIGTQ